MASKPKVLDDSLVGKLLLIRWEPPYGWSMGTIAEKITSATPRLFKKFHYHIKYSDGAWGRRGCGLQLVVPAREGQVRLSSLKAAVGAAQCKAGLAAWHSAGADVQCEAGLHRLEGLAVRY